MKKNTEDAVLIERHHVVAATEVGRDGSRHIASRLLDLPRVGVEYFLETRVLNVRISRAKT